MRVAERGIKFLDDWYCELGVAQSIARQWARFAYATLMGNLEIGRDTPDLMPADAEFSEYVKLMIKTLIPRSASMAVAEEHSSFSADQSSSHATGDCRLRFSSCCSHCWLGGYSRFLASSWWWVTWALRTSPGRWWLNGRLATLSFLD